ncbi:diacylglycerol/lipid kinase family protein [Cohnella thailandensis]|uniref:Diacylglycerol kinase family lipid kinase n=1 Tax=Cohnella thailandensis TaxID=557557 RepID=A0A841T2V8_9BACL|nr:diacylglycerol kinase family protein [Cohnella thailandensis]MBB6637349.1 diacylglycerol kinase family lipid kinase [Cohnella thailandensis]MBP1976678.1 YegS/Rv2252/BmrU family lipid kinase [Cohnella thailandensis]
MIMFIVNPSSGNGKGRIVWDKVESRLRRDGIPYTVVLEDTERQSVELAAKELERGHVKAVAVVGGDGTLHSVLPLLAGGSIPLGLIPAGSGNDTARAFGIPKQPAAALDLILSLRTQPADLLKAKLATGEELLTLTALAIGLDAAVAEDVNVSGYKKWCNRFRIGSLAYIIGLLRALARYKPEVVKVSVDGKEHVFRASWLSAVTNVSNYGGGLKICPEARPTDNRLHVCIVHDCSKIQLLRVFPTILNGSHVRTRYVTVLSGKNIQITAGRSLPAFGDGEPVGHTPLSSSVVPGQLPFITAGVSG